MPAGSTPPQAEVTGRVEALTGLGLEPRLAKVIAKNEKSTANMLAALREVGVSDAPDATNKAGLVYTAISKMGTSVGSTGRSMLLAAIADGRVSSAPYVEAAAAWLTTCYRKLGAGVPNAVVKIEEDTVSIDMKDFEEAAGVGVVVTEKDMESAVNDAINENRAQLVEKRYRFSTGLMQRGIMEKLRFADGKIVSALIKTKVEAILGPKTEADLAKPPKVKKTKAPKQVSQPKEVSKVVVEEKEADPFEGIPSRFDARDLSSAENTPDLLQKHHEATGGKIVTRFPPEPNGYLHIGHAKAMFIDFGYAKKMSGNCILRFDDTNPTVEKREYIEAIKEMVSWMGHEPTKITFSSDYFEQLYDLAVELIKRGKAYVCHQTGDEISRDRKDGVESPWRNRPMEENLRLFADMRKGKYGEGEATLRMKIDMQHANLVMRDPVAYRVLHSPHPHVGDKWCVYPSYDYTHCIVDSLEWITHSLCTLEFEIRRDSYYWLLEALDLYRPFVWESARLNLEYTVMSKRKLKELVEKEYVRGWDDPRMPTLVGMRRRGYTPNALNRFCSAIGISRSSNVIGMHVLEHWVRTELDTTVKRVLAVLRPLKVVIANFRGEETFSVPNHPKDASMGNREVTLTRTVYIEKTDFRMEDSKGYYGLAPGKSAMLRYAYPIKVLEVKTDSTGEADELIVEMDYDKVKKTKGVLHWVGEYSRAFEARLYSTLFKSEDPAGLGDWLADLNDKSEVVLGGGMIEPSAAGAGKGTSFQFERMGYFCVDDDSSKEKPVFNMIVPLRDSR
eukprot:GFKZ01011376.1.p1 GENE.GFKZ01011376.1~~GFKZ01011376.1.p1  ORF type:complete len:787 (-),score=112.62 GFKZ01011376.1:589-2949(-)